MRPCQILALTVLVGAGCGRSGPPPFDPSARVFTVEELKACLGKTVSQVNTQVGVQGSTTTSWLGDDRLLYGMSYQLPGTEMMVFLDEQDPLYRAYSRRSSWDYDGFQQAKVGGISCRTERARIDVGKIPAPWR
jgi:hypothetical protein